MKGSVATPIWSYLTKASKWLVRIYPLKDDSKLLAMEELLTTRRASSSSGSPQAPRRRTISTDSPADVGFEEIVLTHEEWRRVVVRIDPQLILQTHGHLLPSSKSPKTFSSRQSISQKNFV